MTKRLDDLLGRLAAEPIDRSLDRLQADIWRGVARRRAEARTAAMLAPVALASVGLALAMGVVVGGVTAVAKVAAPHGSSAFSVAADLAPSTLLEGGR
ncbi:MAG: hypothetical protein ABI306_11300 [Caulobacteraceae bacterium]